MPWFKVDDKLHSHRKSSRAPIAAMGLWVLAGSWCADHLTDGFIPDYMAHRLDPDADDNAACLVSVGLWTIAEQNGERGWQFHQWADHQPTRDDVESKREAWRDKKRRQRRTPEGQFATSPQESTGASPGDSEGDSLRESHRPVPSRPVPSLNTTTAPRKRGSRLPDDFTITPDMHAWATTHAPNVDPDRETANFRDYWTAKAGRDATKIDWTATWRTWMRRAQENHERRRPARDERVPSYWRGTEDPA